MILFLQILCAHFSGGLTLKIIYPLLVGGGVDLIYTVIHRRVPQYVTTYPTWRSALLVSEKKTPYLGSPRGGSCRPSRKPFDVIICIFTTGGGWPYGLRPFSGWSNVDFGGTPWGMVRVPWLKPFGGFSTWFFLVQQGLKLGWRWLTWPNFWGSFSFVLFCWLANRTNDGDWKWQYISTHNAFWMSIINIGKPPSTM